LQRGNPFAAPAISKGRAMIRDESSYRGKLFSFSRDFRHAAGRSTVPVIASELYNVAHEVPVLFGKAERRRGGSEGRWQVVGVLADRGLRRPLIGAEGEWLGGYSPFALRIHPFRRTPDDGGWEVAPEKVTAAPGRGRPFFGADGAPSQDYAKVRTMLADADHGRAHLSGLAEVLEDAGLLVPLAMAFALDEVTETLAPLFCIDALRLAGTDRASLAGLATGVPSALDLAFCSVYSMRLLRGTFSEAAAADLESRIGALIQQSFAEPAGAVEDDAEPEARRVPEPVAIKGFALDQSAGIDFSGLF
jgi:hypothetical protein